MTCVHVYLTKRVVSNPGGADLIVEDKDTRVQETWFYAGVRVGQGNKRIYAWQDPKGGCRSWSDRTAFIAMVIEALNR